MSAPISQRMRSVPPQSRPGKPKKKNRSWIKTLLFVLAILGVAVLAFGVFYKTGLVVKKTGPHFWNLQLTPRGDSLFVTKKGDDAFELLNPKMLGLVLMAPFFLFWLGKSLADLPWPQRVLSFLLRIAFIALLALGLSRLAKTAYQSKVCTVFMVDVSESVPSEALEDAQKTIDDAWTQRGDGEIRVITFATRPKLIGATEIGNTSIPVPKIERHDAKGQRALGAGTNIQAAMQLSYGLYPAGYVKRAIILSDGVQTAGDALAESNRARDFGIKLFVMPYKRPVPAEVAVRELRMPPRIKVGQTFDIHAMIFSNRPAKIRARLYQGEALNGLEGIRDLPLSVGENDIVFKSVVRIPGAVTYSLEVEPQGPSDLPTPKSSSSTITGASASVIPSGSASSKPSAVPSASAPPVATPPKGKHRPEFDRFAENNKYSVTVAVPGRPNVLYIEGDTSHGNYLTNALVAQEFEVDMRGPDGMPQTLKELERYDFVIWSDVSAEQIGFTQRDVLESYVRDMGGGFIMTGGQNSFGLGGWRGTSVERMLPVRMDAKKNKDQPAIAMSLVIDRSGSMSGQKMEMAKEAAKATAETLSSDDYIEVIGFDSTPIRVVRMQSARNRMRILSDISRITPAGGTDIFPALQMAYDDLAPVAAKRKHIILLSDGEAPSNGIKELVQQMVGDGMTASAVALGDDADKTLMKMVADTGGGRFYFVRDPSSLPRVFTKETELVSRSAAVEEYFQPQVGSPADFIRGIDIENSPYLRGYVATELKPPPAQMTLSPSIRPDQPLLARWRVGLGWTLAWTSDVKNLWAVEWLKWAQYGQFWGQLVREHMRTKKRQQFDMKVELVDGVVHASIDAMSGDDRFQNDLEGKVSIMGPAPKTDKVVVPLRQIAPGRYEVWHTLDQFGSFVLQGELLNKGAAVAESFGHISNPYPREYAAFEADISTMSKMANLTGGSKDPTWAAVTDPAGERMRYHQDLWSNFIKAAIAVFVLDLLLRRVRLFDRKFKAAS